MTTDDYGTSGIRLTLTFNYGEIDIPFTDLVEIVGDLHASLVLGATLAQLQSAETITGRSFQRAADRAQLVVGSRVETARISYNSPLELGLYIIGTSGITALAASRFVSLWRRIDQVRQTRADINVHVRTRDLELRQLEQIASLQGLKKKERKKVEEQLKRERRLLNRISSLDTYQE